MKEAHTNNDQEGLRAHILLAKAGDTSAFEEIYTEYYTPLFRYIMSRIKNKQEAEDMTQTVFMKIWSALPSWNSAHTSPLAFFFTVARNTMTDYFRKASSKEIVSDEAVEKFSEDTASSDDESKTRELKELMSELIEELSSEQQEVITLFYTNDMTYKEIASITRKREDAIRQIHSRAIKKLRTLYTDN